MEGAFGRGLRRGVEEALRRFLDLFGAIGAGADPRREIYVELGRGELRAGRPLEALLAAYRLGARVAWRRPAAAGEAAGLDPQTLYLLAESIFAYIDEISAESVEGYAMEQAAAAGEAQRRRRALARLLRPGPAGRRRGGDAPRPRPPGRCRGRWPRWCARATSPTAWPAPGPRRHRRGLPAGRLRPGARPRRAWPPCPAGGRPGGPPRRPGPGAALAPGPLTRGAGARHLGAGAGPACWPPPITGLSCCCAPTARWPGELAAEALAPLAAETEASRARLRETLAAWLAEQGRTERVAAALHVHPQTVRYRLARLRELFGEALDDADARFELELALRVPR